MRYWTVEEARAYLPRVMELFGVIRRAALVRAGRHPSANGQRSYLLDAEDAYQELLAKTSSCGT
jgi:CHASE3 domain sensor protein